MLYLVTEEERHQAQLLDGSNFRRHSAQTMSLLVCLDIDLSVVGLMVLEMGAETDQSMIAVLDVAQACRARRELPQQRADKLPAAQVAHPASEHPGHVGQEVVLVEEQALEPGLTGWGLRRP